MERTGFTAVAHQRFDIDIAGSEVTGVNQYAMASLYGMRSRLDGRLDVDDLTEDPC